MKRARKNWGSGRKAKKERRAGATNSCEKGGTKMQRKKMRWRRKLRKREKKNENENKNKNLTASEGKERRAATNNYSLKRDQYSAFT